MTPVALDALAGDPEPRYVIIAKDQPQYEPLPALVFSDGRILTEWSLTEEERERLIQGERIRLWIWACGQPVQPVALQVTCPEEP